MSEGESKGDRALLSVTQSSPMVNQNSLFLFLYGYSYGGEGERTLGTWGCCPLFLSLTIHTPPPTPPLLFLILISLFFDMDAAASPGL